MAVVMSLQPMGGSRDLSGPSPPAAAAVVVSRRSGGSALLPLLLSLMLILLLPGGSPPGAGARVLYSSFHKQTHKSNNTSRHYNDVTRWGVRDAAATDPTAAGSTTGGNGRRRSTARMAEPPAIDADFLNDSPPVELLSELDLLRDVYKQIRALRGNMANLKYQNHMIYRQLKRYNNRCSQASGMMLDSAAYTTCPRDFSWNEKTGKCYKFASDRITWRMAREKCRRLGADLISIESQREQRFIVDTARNSKELRHCDFWTGASDQNEDGAWRWVATKNPLSYTNWNHNEPNNGNGDEHCMHMLWVFGWMWNDARCNYESSCFICEIRRQ